MLIGPFVVLGRSERMSKCQYDAVPDAGAHVSEQDEVLEAHCTRFA